LFFLWSAVIYHRIRFVHTCSGQQTKAVMNHRTPKSKTDNKRNWWEEEKRQAAG